MQMSGTVNYGVTYSTAKRICGLIITIQLTHNGEELKSENMSNIKNFVDLANLMKKCLEMIAKTMENKDIYKKFYEQLRRYEQINPKKYMDYMKEGQHDIYYFAGEIIERVPASPLTEMIVKKGLNVIYMEKAMDPSMSTVSSSRRSWMARS